MTPLDPTLQAASLALVHFVWQGAVVALVAAAAMRAARTPAARYAIGVVTMAAMLAAPFATSLWMFERLSPAPSTSTSVSADESRAAGSSVNLAPRLETQPVTDASAATTSFPLTAASTEAAVLFVWACGVLLLSGRLAGGWMVARRLARRAIEPARPEIAMLARRVAGRLAVDRAVRVFESSAIAVPMMIGWVRPVVLLPVAALGGLTPTQLEALIAHELAHVRRHDYLVNLLQSAVETLLFYHPAVWWISRQVRTEREHCCDDLAVSVCDRLVYVSALADLAALSALTPRPLALAASDGSLLARVRRLLGGAADRRSPNSIWTLLAATFVVVIAGLQFSPWAQRRLDAAALPQTVVVSPVGQDMPPLPVTAPMPKAVPVASATPSASDDATAVAIATPVLAGETQASVVVVETPQTQATAEIEAQRAAKAKIAEELDAIAVKNAASKKADLDKAALKERLDLLQQQMRQLEQQVGKKQISSDDERLKREQLEALTAKMKTALSERSLADARVAEKSKLASAELQSAEIKSALEKMQTVQRAALKGGSARDSNGTYIWSEDGHRVSVRWTGLFKLADDDRDLAWVAPGQSVELSDDNPSRRTSVELSGDADGRVNHAYRLEGLNTAFDPDGKTYLANALGELIAHTGFAADMRVARILRTGGVDAVLKEIDRLQSDDARHAYYVELIHQANLSPADLARIGKKASETIKSSDDLAAVIVDGAKYAKGNADTLRALLAVTPKISDAHDRDRATLAVMAASPTTRPTAKVVLPATDPMARAMADEDAVQDIRARLKTPGLNDKTAADLFGRVGALTSDTARADALIEILDGRTLTPVQRKLYVQTAERITSDYDQNRALAALVRAESGRL